ncbi:MAG TPA: hypothetical protein VGM22_18420 [Methylomirabilota bacterium]|jgi:hypothetical protein
MVPVWLLAVALAAGTAPAAPASEYDLVWTAFAREVRYQRGESQPVAAGERSGRARARLISVRSGVLRLEWRGEGGDGSGLIGPAGPTSFSFPSPLVITGPPPLPHLSGGAFDFSGDPEHPETFTVSYVEGFICRATPPVCSGVAMWERRFDARATRVEVRQGYFGGSIFSTAAATPLASSVGVKGLSTMDRTPLSVARPITSRVPWAVIITTRKPGRTAHARWMNSSPFSSGIL